MPSTLETSTALSTHPPFSTTTPSRLQALYSDFSRQRLSNPTSYRANIEWWRKALEHIVRAGLQSATVHSESIAVPTAKSRLILHADSSLLDRIKLERVGKPLALGSVVAELSPPTALNLFPRRSFFSYHTSIYSARTFSARLGSALWATLEYVGAIGEDGIFGFGAATDSRSIAWYADYIVIPLVEEAADAIISHQRRLLGGLADSLYTFKGFCRTFKDAVSGEMEELATDDAQVLLKFLERDRGVISVDGDIVKFLSDNASLEARNITAVDRGILELKSALETLRSQVDRTQEKIKDYMQKASAALQQKHRSLALSHLRSRKRLEDLLTQRLGAIGNLEETLISVEAAAGNVEILQTYSSSTATLRAILAHSSLQRENIDETMNALAEANADAQEIDDAVRASNVGVIPNMDDLEDGVEKELAALVKEVEAEEVKHKLEEAGKVGAIPPPSVTRGSEGHAEQLEKNARLHHNGLSRSPIPSLVLR